MESSLRGAAGDASIQNHGLSYWIATATAWPRDDNRVKVKSSRYIENKGLPGHAQPNAEIPGFMPGDSNHCVSRSGGSGELVRFG